MGQGYRLPQSQDRHLEYGRRLLRPRDEDFVKDLATHKPLRVVFRDAGYNNNPVKINVEQIFKLLSPSTEVKSI